MLQLRSMIIVADNSGAKQLQLIGIAGGYKQRYARVGDIIKASVKVAQPHGLVKKSQVVDAVIVRTRKEIRRNNGTYVRFGDNAAVIIDKKSKEPVASRVFGPVARELKPLGYNKIISLAAEVL